MTALGLYNPETKHAICHPGHIGYAKQAPGFLRWGEYNLLLKSNYDVHHGELHPSASNACNCCLLSPSDDTVIYGNGHDIIISGNYPDGLGIIEKVNRAGEIVWSIPASESDNDGGIFRMEYLPSGNIVTCGSLKSGSNPYNVLIVNPANGTIVQRIVVPVPDNGYMLYSVVVDPRDSSFVVAGNVENASGATENVFKYVLSGGTYVLDWEVHTALGDKAWLAAIASNGDIIIGVEFWRRATTEDANYHIYVYDEDGNELAKWQPPNAFWSYVEGPDQWQWTNLLNEEVYGGFVDINGNLFYSTPNSMYKYSSSYVHVEDIDFGNYDEPRDFEPTSTKGIWFCKQRSTDWAHFMIFNTSSRTLTKLYSQPAPGIGIYPATAHQARKDRLPRILTKGTGHFFPLFKEDCAAFIDHTILSYMSEWGTPDEHPELDYDEGDILVVGSNYYDTDEFMGEVRQALQDGNTFLDDFYNVDSRFWKRISHTSPRPFRTKHTYNLAGYLCYHDGAYYKAKNNSAGGHSPPDTDYWEVVDAPNPKWDSFEGYGGKGHLATPPTLSPQVYTFAIAGILNTSDELHAINGVYHLVKHYGAKEIHWSSGFYRYNYMGFEGTAQKLIITFHIYQKMATSGDPTYIRETILKVTLANLDVPKWQSGDSYDTGEWTKIQSEGAWVYYSSNTDDNTEQPPHANWDAEGMDPPDNDSLFEKTFDDTNNYGCMMSGDEVANENTDHSTVGHDGTISFYPGKIKAWEARVVYASGEKCVFGGRFYSSNSDNNKNNQPDVTGWTVIT